jgi:hypothetical protein
MDGLSACTPMSLTEYNHRFGIGFTDQQKNSSKRFEIASRQLSKVS